VLVSDYGRGVAALPEVVGRSTVGPAGPPLVWDPHRAGPRPPAHATLVTPNIEEAWALAGERSGGASADSIPDLVAMADALAGGLGCAVAVTAGEQGAVLAETDAIPVVVPTRPASGDVCGAGDAFAAHAALALAAGSDRRRAVEAGVAAARAFVAERAGLAGLAVAPVGVVPLVPAPDEAPRAAAVRQAGGVVVAAGGCFDVLHAGHVQLLEQARRLGDHLVVLLNGDASVGRLKGAGRPLNAAGDRAAVLRSLGCVDEVVVFDEDTPSAALAAVRPHLFVKGADYAGARLEERDVVARWGGRVVLVPLVEGRSTTRLIDVAAAAGA
jgi:rfaE bifunctional protein nucleotidyltransferase chain/domain